MCVALTIWSCCLESDYNNIIHPSDQLYIGFVFVSGFAMLFLWHFPLFLDASYFDFGGALSLSLSLSGVFCLLGTYNSYILGMSSLIGTQISTRSLFWVFACPWSFQTRGSSLSEVLILQQDARPSTLEGSASSASKQVSFLG